MVTSLVPPFPDKMATIDLPSGDHSLGRMYGTSSFRYTTRGLPPSMPIKRSSYKNWLFDQV